MHTSSIIQTLLYFPQRLIDTFQPLLCFSVKLRKIWYLEIFYIIYTHSHVMYGIDGHLLQ